MLTASTNNVVRQQQPQAKPLSKLHVTDVGTSQCFLVAQAVKRCDASQSAYDAYNRIGQALCERDAQIVHERIFGSLSVESRVRGARAKVLRENNIACDNPVTYIEGNPPWGKGGDWGDLTFMYENDPLIGRIAVVADENRQDEMLMFLGAGRRQAEVKVFFPDEAQDARDWLQSKSE